MIKPLIVHTQEALISKIFEEGKIYEGSWRSEHGEMASVSISGSNNFTKSSKEIREEFCNYFNTTGAVPCQEKFI